MRPHRPEDSILVRAATLATVLTAVAAVAVQEEFTPQAAAAAVTIAVGFVVSHRRRRASNGWLKLLIAALVLLVARDFFAALLANPHDPRVPLVRLFLWLQVLHSFDLPARRDLKYSLASAVVLVAVAAVYSREVTFGLFLIAFAMCGSVALVAMAPGQRADLRPRTAAALGSALAAGVLCSAAVAFAAVPRHQGYRVQWLPTSPQFRFVQRFYDRVINPAYPDAGDRSVGREPPVFNPTGYIGFSTYVDLRMRGVLDHTLVMRVRATRPAFWRGLAFDEYTGQGWRMRDRTVEEFTSDTPRIIPRFGADEPWPAGSEAVVQTFYIEREQPNVIFGAYRPFEVYFPAGSLGVDRYAGLRSPVPLEQGLIYSVISRVPDPAPGLLRSRSAEAPAAIRARYLQLPPVPQRVRDLARRLTAGYATSYEKALAVNRYLLANHRYNLQAPPLPPEADAVDHFLFAAGEGSCETFASAMAVLLRAAGVPARVVTGYTSGRYNFLTGYYEVRNSDAHAWVEVYIPRVGWIEFEPTPGFDAPAALAGNRIGRWPLRDAAAWIADRFAPVLPRALAALTAAGAAGRGGLHPAVGFSAVLVLTGLLVRRLRNGHDNGGPTGDAIETVYARMLSTLERAGYRRAPQLTPREYAATIPDPPRSSVLDVTAAFEAVRYGRRRATPELAGQARRALDDLAGSLRRTRWRR